MALELRFGLLTSGLAAWGGAGTIKIGTGRIDKPTPQTELTIQPLETGHACESAMNAPVKARFMRFCEAVHNPVHDAANPAIHITHSAVDLVARDPTDLVLDLVENVGGGRELRRGDHTGDAGHALSKNV